MMKIAYVYAPRRQQTSARHRPNVCPFAR